MKYKHQIHKIIKYNHQGIYAFKGFVCQNLYIYTQNMPGGVGSTLYFTMNIILVKEAQSDFFNFFFKLLKILVSQGSSNFSHNL